jgi:hypothetical protein
MEFIRDKKILNEAIKNGCKTAREFALYLQRKESLLAILKEINQ